MPSPLYADLDKRARASNSNSNRYWDNGNEPSSRTVHAHDKRGDQPDDSSEAGNVGNNSENGGDNPAPVKFSISNEPNVADSDIEEIRQRLISRRAPADLSSYVLARFISKTCGFLISSGPLWQRKSTR